MLAPSFRYNAGLIRANGTPFFTGDGSTSSAQLVDRHGNPISSAKLKRVDAIYRTDWQGRQLLYPTARTNQFLYSSDCTHWSKTTGVTSVANATTAPDGTNNASSVSYDGSGVAGSYRCYHSASVPASGQPVSQYVYLRADTPTTIRVNGNVVSGGIQTCHLTTSWQKYNLSGVGNGSGIAQLLLYSDSADNTPWTIYVAASHLELAAMCGAYISTTTAVRTVTDYSISGSTVNFGETPLAGAVCDWTGVARR